MDRLTKRTIDGSIMIENATKIAEAFDRLAAYEDTGLTPEEIEQTLGNFSTILCYVTDNHMSKTNYTVEAMKCEIDDCLQKECDECKDRQFAEKYEKAEAEGRLIVLPCKMGGVIYRAINSRPIKGDKPWKYIKQSRLTWNSLEGALRDFGKTVFLTREEAEAALKGETNAAD